MRPRIQHPVLDFWLLLQLRYRSEANSDGHNQRLKVILGAKRNYCNMRENPRDSIQSADLPEFFTIWLDEINFLVKRSASEDYEIRFGVRLNELRILRVIYRKPGISQKELLEKLWFEKTATSRLVSALAKRGLVLRSICNDDARVTNMNLSTKGKKLVEEAAAFGEGEARSFLLSALSEEEAGAFEKHIQALLRQARLQYRK